MNPERQEENKRMWCLRSSEKKVFQKVGSDSRIRKHTTFFKNGPNTWTDKSPKKTDGKYAL